MAASSVTGVGNGSADGMNKGSEHTTLGVHHLIGTRVVAAGRVTLSAGVATVKFPVPFVDSNVNYVVIPHAYNVATVPYVTALTDTSSAFTSFALAGGTTDVIHWMVVRIGFDM